MSHGDSSICSIFVRGGSILCIVTGSRRYSSDFPQGGLEIPCTLEFISHDKKESEKAERLLESALSKKVGKKILKEIKENDNFDVSVAVPLPAPKKKLSPKDVVDDLMADDEMESPPAKKPKLDYERIIMGEELLDMEINFAQRLLKAQHPKCNGFQSTLVVRKVGQFENNIQIVHCASRHHWIAATTVNCTQREVKVYDSIFFTCDKETLLTLNTLYKRISEHLTITMCRCQKEAGGTDCGLFSIAFADALAHGINPGMLKFHQDKMRSHLVDCFNKQIMIPFPCQLLYVKLLQLCILLIII